LRSGYEWGSHYEYEMGKKKLIGFWYIGQAKEQGFQIVQLPVAEIMRLDDRAFRDVKIDLLESGLSFEVFESPLPEGVNTTERGFNIYAWIEYLKKAIGRISELGCKTLFGEMARRGFFQKKAKPLS